MPTPALLWAYTDSGWKPVLVDTLGHLQVDVLSCANPGNLDAALSKWLPVAKARIFNTAMPAINTAMLGSDITPTSSPSFLLVYVCLSVPAIFYVIRTVGAANVHEGMNGFVRLNAYSAYLFTVPWRTGDSINFASNNTGGTIWILDVLEVVGA